MKIQTPKGTKDIYGQEVLAWQKLEGDIRDICRAFGFKELRPPIFEYTELFVRNVGETTDVVQKEMYTFTDKSDRSLTLRPEITAGFARAVVGHGLYSGPLPLKLYHIGPCFRCENTQAGRMRQFHQFNLELYGAAGPEADGEILAVGYTVMKKLDLKNIELHINSLGGPACRNKYNEVLKAFIGGKIDRLCPTCVERYKTNPLRALDCKEEKCRAVLEAAPSSIDTLDKECREHFEALQKILKAYDIPFVVDPMLVRGLDYYTRTVFEFISGDIGAQGTVCGGGRYDNMLEQCGGPPTPAVGFAMGMERLLMAQDSEELQPSCDIYLGYIGETAGEFARRIVFELRQQGLTAEGNLMNRGVKAQMKYANKIGARYAVIIGDDELSSGLANIKNMETGEQESVELEKLAGFLKA